MIRTLLLILSVLSACSPADSTDIDAQDSRNGGEDVAAQDSSTSEDTAVSLDAADTNTSDTSDAAGLDTALLEDTLVGLDSSGGDTEAQADVAAPEPFGALAGTCGEVDTELTDAAAFLFSNSIDFGTDPFDEPEDVPRLSADGQYILAQPNAGGSSVLSEVFAFEVLYRCEAASLLKTETEITYDPTHTGSITDILVEIEGHKVGVSVTRAFKFPPSEPYTVVDATTLLEKKLGGINESSLGVSAEDTWVKQILFIVAYAPEHVPSLQTAFDDIAAAQPGLLDDTILYITVTDGDDDWLY